MKKFQFCVELSPFRLNYYLRSIVYLQTNIIYLLGFFFNRFFSIFLSIDRRMQHTTLSLSSAHICLSLSHAVALLVYRVHMSVLVYHCYSPCLTRAYVCPCLSLLLSLSTARICLSLFNTVAFLVYRAYRSVLVARQSRKARVCDKDTLRSIGKKIQLFTQRFLWDKTRIERKRGA